MKKQFAKCHPNFAAEGLLVVPPPNTITWEKIDEPDSHFLDRRKCVLSVIEQAAYGIFA